MTDIEKQFEIYREYFRQECERLANYIGVYKRFYDRKKDYLEEINVAPCFFQITIDSLYSSIIMWTDKLFDKKSERGFNNFLKFIEHNRELVSVAELKRRQNYPDHHWMLENREDITFKDIQNDRERIKKLACLSNIKVRRDKFHAHFDKDYFFDRKKLGEDAPLLWTDLEEILELMGDLVNKYSVAYDGKSYVLGAINTKDLDRLLARVRKGKHKGSS